MLYQKFSPWMIGARRLGPHCFHPKYNIHHLNRSWHILQCRAQVYVINEFINPIIWLQLFEHLGIINHFVSHWSYSNTNLLRFRIDGAPTSSPKLSWFCDPRGSLPSQNGIFLDGNGSRNAWDPSCWSVYLVIVCRWYRSTGLFASYIRTYIYDHICIYYLYICI